MRVFKSSIFSGGTKVYQVSLHRQLIVFFVVLFSPKVLVGLECFACCSWCFNFYSWLQFVFQLIAVIFNWGCHYIPSHYFFYIVLSTRVSFLL